MLFLSARGLFILEDVNYSSTSSKTSLSLARCKLCTCNLLCPDLLWFGSFIPYISLSFGSPIHIHIRMIRPISKQEKTRLWLDTLHQFLFSPGWRQEHSKYPGVGRIIPSSPSPPLSFPSHHQGFQVRQIYADRSDLSKGQAHVTPPVPTLKPLFYTLSPSLAACQWHDS